VDGSILRGTHLEETHLDSPSGKLESRLGARETGADHDDFAQA
jgi:hypothetical protein